MIILDGKKIKSKILNELHDEVENLVDKPNLVVIQVGDNEASNIYIKQKEKMTKYVGYGFKLLKFKENIREKEIIKEIDKLNNDSSVHAILVQLPLPKHLNVKLILNSINEKKDVDGLSSVNAGKLFHDEGGLIPCTPLGVMRLLTEYEITVSGKNIAMVGASDLVGKPLAILFNNAGATVTLCHSLTKNLKEHTLLADIVVVAVGKSNLITADMVREGAIVVDVGINRVNDKICGDVCFFDLVDKVSYITPVPGGVGPMTIAMLGVNILEAYKMQKDSLNG